MLLSFLGYIGPLIKSAKLALSQTLLRAPTVQRRFIPAEHAGMLGATLALPAGNAAPTSTFVVFAEIFIVWQTGTYWRLLVQLSRIVSALRRGNKSRKCTTPKCSLLRTRWLITSERDGSKITNFSP